MQEETDETVSVGIGGPRPRAAGPYGVAFQAEQTLALGRALFGAGRVTRYDEFDPYAFVLLLHWERERDNHVVMPDLFLERPPPIQDERIEPRPLGHAKLVGVEATHSATGGPAIVTDW